MHPPDLEKNKIAIYNCRWFIEKIKLDVFSIAHRLNDYATLDELYWLSERFDIWYILGRLRLSAEGRKDRERLRWLVSLPAQVVEVQALLLEIREGSDHVVARCKLSDLKL